MYRVGVTELIEITARNENPIVDRNDSDCLS